MMKTQNEILVINYWTCSTLIVNGEPVMSLPLKGQEHSILARATKGLALALHATPITVEVSYDELYAAAATKVSALAHSPDAPRKEVVDEMAACMEDSVYALIEIARAKTGSMLAQREALLEKLQGMSLTSHDLDEVVMDACDSLRSGINNGGVDSQLEFLVSMGYPESEITKDVPTDLLDAA